MTATITPSEAAALVGTTARTIQRWANARVIQARKVGGRWFVMRDAFLSQFTLN